DPRFWLSEGWLTRGRNGWEAPLYWEKLDRGDWWIHTLHGLEPISPEEPVSHISYYEADAYARWRGLRLPTEQEWEHTARFVGAGGEANFLESGELRPRPARG